MPQKPTSQDIRQISALIARLMNHYWTAADPVATRQAQLDDWLGDLVEFGPEIVAEACGEWRRQPGGKRPTPGDIRTIAIRLQRERQEPEVVMLPAPERKRRLEDRARREEELIRGGREITDAWARAAGFDNFEAYLDAGGTYDNALPQILAWSRGRE